MGYYVGGLQRCAPTSCPFNAPRRRLGSRGCFSHVVMSGKGPSLGVKRHFLLYNCSP